MAASLSEKVEARKRIRLVQGTQRSLPTDPARISFADNDYLALSRDPRIAEAAIDAIRNSGTGARAARHLAGPCHEHAELEAALAEWKGTSSALVFASGYQTPLGVIPSLVGPQDTVLLERNAHACLFDGAKLSGARLRIFPRNDFTQLEEVLNTTRKLNPGGNILILAESLHSMEGDLADLKVLVTLKKRFAAWLLLDEAHANGCLGPEGSGVAAEQGLAPEIDIHMGTLGKALGSSGGFVAAPNHITDHLLNEARTFLFGTAPSPAAVAAAAGALRVVRSPEGDQLREKLRCNIRLFSTRAPEPRNGPIQARIFGSNEATLRARDFLRNLGLEAAAIRPPTVPEGTARLRMSLSARHTENQIRQLTDALSQCPPA